jgi:hypothetical protein
MVGYFERSDTFRTALVHPTKTTLCVDSSLSHSTGTAEELTEIKIGVIYTDKNLDVRKDKYDISIIPYFLALYTKEIHYLNLSEESEFTRYY